MISRWMIILFVAFLAGCSSRPTLAGGEWKADVLGGSTTFVFGRDGSMKMDIGLPIGSLGAEGTYSETENSVSLTLQRIELPDNPIGAGARRITDQVVNRPLGFDVEWKSPNEVKLTPQIPAGPFGQVMTLKRKESP